MGDVHDDDENVGGGVVDNNNNDFHGVYYCMLQYGKIKETGILKKKLLKSFKI